MYVGSLTQDIWSKRVSEGFVSPFAIEEADTGYCAPSQRLDPQQVIKLCEDEGVDPSDKKQRTNASPNYAKRRQSEWIDEQLHKRMAISEDDQDSPSPNKLGHATVIPSVRLSMDAIDTSRTGQEEDAGEILIDPELLQSTQSLYDVVVNGSQDYDLPEVEAAIFDHVYNPHPATMDALLTKDTLEFVRQYSTINISRNQTLAQSNKDKRAAVLVRLEGNSRDKVNKFYVRLQELGIGLHLYPCEPSQSQETQAKVRVRRSSQGRGRRQ